MKESTGSAYFVNFVTIGDTNNIEKDIATLIGLLRSVVTTH